MASAIKLSDSQHMLVTQLSSFSALACWYPDYARKLDEQMRTLKKINETNLVKQNYWKGIGRQMVFQPAFPFIFGIKDYILKKLTNDGKVQPSAFQVVISASIAGALSGPYCNAGEVYVMRRRVYQNENWHQSLRQIWNRSGPSAFLKGTPLMSLRNMQFGGILAGVNPVLGEKIDQRLNYEFFNKKNEIIKSIIVAIFSAVPAAQAASVSTMVADNIAVRRQTFALDLDQSKSNVEAIKQIYSESGWRGFFVGTKFRCRQATREFIAFNLFLEFYSHQLKKYVGKGSGMIMSP